MVALLIATRRLFLVTIGAWRDPNAQALLILAALILLGGMEFYHDVEGWSRLDAFYFCAVTLATIGYGDLHPTTDLSKLFTVAYLFIGIGVMVTLFAYFARAGLLFNLTGAARHNFADHTMEADKDPSRPASPSPLPPHDRPQ